VSVPRLLAFYQDVVDEELGTPVGWQTIAWGLTFPDGSAVTVPAEGPTAATVWHSLEDATKALDAYVDTPDPRSRTDGPLSPTAAPRRTPGQEGDGS
jgi:hypothetical protein